MTRRDSRTRPSPAVALQHSGQRTRPTFEVEAAAIAAGSGSVAGIDEAGRGPWAGPVVAAAVILDPHAIPDGIDDSKALDEQQREAAYAQIVARAIVGVGVADVDRIDRDNILAATLWAMAEAVRGLTVPPALCLVDGNRLPGGLPGPARAIVKGDAISLSIAAASIVAKVTRDRIMVELAEAYPGYGFERHKGYGVPAHRAALERLGVTPHHRRSFEPVRAVIGRDLPGRRIDRNA